MKKLDLLTLLLFLIPILGLSQVGIGTTSPHGSSALDISSTTSGLLIPRMTQAQRNAITAPSTGLMIYQTNNTPGFYYYTGSSWSPFVGGSSWELTGNSGTNASSDFLGTTDATDLVFRTNNTEKARVTSTGNFGVGTNTPTTRLHLVAPPAATIFNDGFEDSTLAPFTASGSSFGWNIQSGGGNFNSGLRGARSGAGNNNGTYILELTQTLPANGGTISFAFRVGSELNYDYFRFYIDGVQQSEWSGTVAWNTVSYPVSGGAHTFRWSYEKDGSVNTSPDRAWVDDVEITSNSSALRIVDGSQGDGKILVSDANGLTSWQSMGSVLSSSAPVWSLDGNAGTTPGTDFLGTTDNTSLVFKTNNNEYSRVLSNGRVGIGTISPDVKLHVEDDALGRAVIRGVNSNSNTSNLSYGIRGESNSTALGSAGVIGVSTNSGQNEMGVIGDYGLWGTGVFGLGWASSYTDMPTSRDFGVFGTCNFPTGTGVYAVDRSNSAGSYAFYGVGKYAVTGTKSASVPTTRGNQLVYCTESPEIWFEDLGGGKLINGQVHIDLDPMYLETIFVSDEHKMRIFLQEEGESNGLIVIKDEDNKGFTVKEKNGGQSNIEFSYRIMAKRRFYQNQRFGVDANQPFENNLIKAKDAEVITTNPEEMKRYVEEQTRLKESMAKKESSK